MNEIKENAITEYLNICLSYNINNNDKPYGHTIGPQKPI